ncbi:hypothetical protein [Cognatishimia sp. F0-27]|uniref:hypothetical protein n=1 Tax=Cognatishimia sp. F0-27 TaxID=2816855 RepID=UPI001D0C1174|nr:hypothetical protein [Cognatishimia sp. F0-27]MCC1494367.1 hypothetical protein [Cognatishimia sp. F0-27]
MAKVLGDRHLILHVGTTKTGTTSLQRALADSTFGEEDGWSYPIKDRLILKAHHNLAYEVGSLFQELGRFQESKGTWREMRQEVLASDLRTVILSSEAFSFLSSEDLVRLKREVSHFGRLTIHIYLRRIDLWLHSRYIQKAKFGRVALDGNIRTLKADARTDIFDVDVAFQGALVRRWREAFGADAVAVSLYGPQDAGHDVIAHFMRYHGLDGGRDWTVSQRANVSPSLKSLLGTYQFLRICSDAIGEQATITPAMGVALSEYFGAQPDVVSGRYRLFSHYLAQQFYDEFAEDQVQLAEMLGRDVPIFDPPTRAEYKGYVKEPLALIDRFTEDDHAFLNRLSTTYLHHKRAKRA